jgi:hypothetical protein
MYSGVASGYVHCNRVQTIVTEVGFALQRTRSSLLQYEFGPAASQIRLVQVKMADRNRNWSKLVETSVSPLSNLIGGVFSTPAHHLLPLNWSEM